MTKDEYDALTESEKDALCAEHVMGMEYVLWCLKTDNSELVQMMQVIEKMREDNWHYELKSFGLEGNEAAFHRSESVAGKYKSIYRSATAPTMPQAVRDAACAAAGVWE